jgi:exopolysaccharide biosynthesis polyprenyl glycosylphosphotransferase
MTKRNDYHHSLMRSLNFAAVLCAFAATSELANLLGTWKLFTWPDSPPGALAGWPPDYEILLLSSLISWSVVSAYFEGRESRHNVESGWSAYWRTARMVAVWAAVTEASTFLLKLQTISRQFTLSFAALAGLMILARHLLEVRLSTASRSDRRKAVIVGVEHEARWLARALAAKPEWSDKTEIIGPRELPALTAKCVSNELAPDIEFFILPFGQDIQTVESCTLGLLKQKRAVHIVPAIIDTTLFRHALGDLDGVPLITLESGRLAAMDAGLKRILDTAGAAILLVMLCPLMALIAALVKLTSPGPAFFSQQRLGRNGRRFTIYKFRTMRQDAETLLQRSPALYAKYKENNFKLPNGDDFRITRLGRILRATSLDELPQLLNVLKGDMSLVGPRPIVPAEIENYGEYASLLLSVKPGMTGQWQVNGRANVADYAHRVKLDMEYIRDQSFGADVEILVKTIAAVARMEGAH